MTDQAALAATIDEAFERRAELNAKNSPPALRHAIEECIELLDSGQARVCEKKNGAWTVNQWLKKAVLLYFRTHDNSIVEAGYTRFFDKVPLKDTARERLKFPVSRIESTLASEEWLAGPRYSIADIDAYAMLRTLPDLAPDVVNESVTPRLWEYLQRISQRPAVKAALAMSRSGKPEQHFVPGVEPSRWG